MSENSSRPSGEKQPTEEIGNSQFSQPTKPPTYKRMKRKGRADSACCYINGKRVLLGLYGSNESRQRFAELIGGAKVAAAPIATSPTNPTIDEILLPFLEYAQTYYGQSDSKEYSAYCQVAKWLRQDAGQERAEDYGPKRLKQLREKMIVKGWKRKTINGNVKKIVRIFRWAVSEELLEPEVHGKLATVENLKRGRSKAKESQPVRPIDDATVKATIKKLPAVVADMVRFQRLTGCRPGEMTILRPCDVDRVGEVGSTCPAITRPSTTGTAVLSQLGPRRRRSCSAT